MGIFEELISANTMSDAEVKNNVAAEAPTAEELKAKKRSAEDDDVDVKKQKTENGKHDEENGEDQDSAFESDEEIDDKEYYKVNQPSLQTKSAIAAFLPPQHLWSWSDEGRKLSPKSRKVYHDIIEKDDEKIKVGDCVVFLSTGRPDRPYIGRIDSMWQNTTGNMRVQVMWFYHPAEVEGTAVGGGRVEDIRRKGALFSSNHYDENDVQTISHKCQVLQLQEFTTANIVDSDSDDTYYVAGQYDPVEGVIVFIQGLWE